MERHSNPLMECLAHIIAALCKKFGSGKFRHWEKMSLDSSETRVGKMWSCNKIMMFCPYSIHIIQANLMNTKTLMLVFGKSLERVFDYLKKPAKEHGTKYCSWPWIWYMTSNHLFDLSTVFFFQMNPNEKMNMNLSWSVYYWEARQSLK